MLSGNPMNKQDMIGVSRMNKEEAVDELIQKITDSYLQMNEEDVLDESWRKDTDELKARARSQEVADFVEDLAQAMFYHNHTLLWEAMISVVEAEERGDFEGMLGDEE